MSEQKGNQGQGRGRDNAPGQQKEITVPNTDPSKEPWTGKKADYANQRAELEAQGYVRSDDDEGDDESSGGESEG